jgi:hypothetical protein
MTAASNEVVAVIQADRDIAHEIMQIVRGYRVNLPHDRHWLIDIVARHRIAHSDPRPVAEGLREALEEVERLRGLLVDPGSPAWEDARTVLVAELRKAGLEKRADRVAEAQPELIPSDIALNLIAHAATHSPAPMAGEVFRQALELSGMAYAIANDIATGQRIARDALVAHPSTQEGGK